MSLKVPDFKNTNRNGNKLQGNAIFVPCEIVNFVSYSVEKGKYRMIINGFAGKKKIRYCYDIYK